MPFYERTVKEIPDIEKPAIEYAKKRGWMVEKVKSLSRNGFPDRYFLRNGRTVLVEFKAPDKPPTPQQLKRHREIREHGGEIHVIDNLDYAFALFK